MGVTDLIIYRIVQEKQPEVVEELRRRRLLRWRPGGEAEETVTIDGQPYRDVTEEATAAAVGVGETPRHDAYRRHRGALRQVRWA
ncbi:MAG: hypothetical protein ACM3VX_05000 [Bacteroidota bacterium]